MCVYACGWYTYERMYTRIGIRSTSHVANTATHCLHERASKIGQKGERRDRRRIKDTMTNGRCFLPLWKTAKLPAPGPDFLEAVVGQRRRRQWHPPSPPSSPPPSFGVLATPVCPSSDPKTNVQQP